MHLNTDLIKLKNRYKQSGKIKKLSKIQKDLGDIYYETGRFEDALEEYSEQLELCKILDDKLELLVAHRMIGEAHIQLGSYDEALIHLQTYLDGASASGNIIEEQRAYTTLGRLYLCLSETEVEDAKHSALEKARTAYAKSIFLCEKLAKSNTQLLEKDLASMQARAFLNFGLVQNVETGISWLKKAEDLCTKYKLIQDLHMTYIALGSLYEKKDDYDKAKEYFDRAANNSDIALRANALIAKTEMMLKLGNWLDARKTLINMYKNKDLPINQKENVEKLLRIVVTICRTERKLSDETDYDNNLSLYEKLGDASVAVYCFTKAIFYYEQMLQCAEKTSSDRIGAALVSLAQTLRDAGQYSKALIYARREFELVCTCDEACKSSLYIADLLIDAKASDAEIREAFEIAMNHAVKSGQSSLEISVFKEMLHYFEKTQQVREVTVIKEKLKQLDRETSDSENDDHAERKSCEEIGADICLNDLTDTEDEVDKGVRRTKMTVSRQRCFTVKRNEKGESQLQVACINGKIAQVKKLVESGHPVNVRDAIGWTPLHEAANYGFVDIAQFLIEAGADVNDPGSEDCNGMTPLHDAASCGHFPIIYLLLNNGANPNVLMKDGSSVLDCLIEWRKRVGELSAADQIEYSNLHEKLSSLITIRSCHSSKGNIVLPKMFNRTLSTDERYEINKLDDKNKVEEDDMKLSAEEFYKRTIESLKRRSNISNSTLRNFTSQKVKGPLLDSEEVLLDNWLEDDLGPNDSKSSVKHSAVYKCSSSSSTKRKFGSNNHSNRNAKRHRCNSVNTSNTNMDTNILFYDSESESDSSVEFVTNPQPIQTNKNVSQTTLLDNNFQVKTTSHNLPLTITSVQDSSLTKVTKTTVVHLKISLESKTYNLEVLLPNDNEKRVQDLLEEISLQYRNDTGADVRLILAHAKGNIINAKSTLSSVTDNGTITEFKSEIVDIQIPVIEKRYDILCKIRNIDVKDAVLESLYVCRASSAFIINPKMTREEELVPLLKSLKYEANLRILCLSGISLFFEGKLLDATLTEHEHLTELNLQKCDITYNCLSKIRKLPIHLITFNLSYNPLGSKCREKLYNLLIPLKQLKMLNVSCCDLLVFHFDQLCESLSNLDISSNALEEVSIDNLSQRYLTSLNVSNTVKVCSDTSVIIEIVKNRSFLTNTIECLNLSNCGLSDSDVKVILQQTPCLQKFVINNNKNITHISVNRVLGFIPTLHYISAIGCKEISELPHPETFLINPTVCTLLVNMKYSIINKWEILWRNKCLGNVLPGNIVKFQPIQ